MPKVRFPAQFDALYNKPRAYYGQPIPVREIHYEYEIPAQTYHAEKMKAQHAYDLATIASKAHFQHTTFREPRPGYVATNPINNGARPFQTSVDGGNMPLATFPGRLGTFVNNQSHLRGGVLSSVEGQKYARDILDRRAKQVRAMENPELPPEPEAVLTPQDADKIEMTQLLQEVLDATSLGAFSPDTYSSLRRFTGLLLRNVVYLSFDDLNTIRLALQDAVLDQDALTNNDDHHGSAPTRGSLASARINRAKSQAVGANLRKLYGFMEDMCDGVVGSNDVVVADEANKTSMRSVGTTATPLSSLPESAKRQLVRASAKFWGIGALRSNALETLDRRDSDARDALPLGALPPPGDGGDGGDSDGEDSGGSSDEEGDEGDGEASSASARSAPPPPARSAPRGRYEAVDAEGAVRGEFENAWRTSNLAELRAISRRIGLWRSHANLDTRSRTQFRNKWNATYPAQAF